MTTKRKQNLKHTLNSSKLEEYTTHEVSKWKKIKGV